MYGNVVLLWTAERPNTLGGRSGVPGQTGP
jgi:hypothetical protein